MRHPLMVLAVLIVGTFGPPVILGFSWFDQPTGFALPGERVEAYNSAVDGFSFPNVDLPNRKFAAHELSHGRFPFWNPYASLGLPFPEQYQNEVFFPLEWIEMFLGPTALQLTLMLKIFAAGTGAYVFVWRLVENDRKALIAAVLYAFSAYFLWFHQIAAFVNGAALVPWIFWAALRLFDSAIPFSRRAAVLGLFSGFMWLTGQPQLIALTLLFSGLFVLARSLSFFAASPCRRVAASGLSAFALGCLLGFGVGFVQLSLFYRMLGLGFTIHSPGSYIGGGTAPLNLTTTLWPYLLGQLMAPFDGSLYPAQINWEGFPFLLGASGLALVLLGIAGAWINGSGAIRATAVLLLAAILVVVAGTTGHPIWTAPILNRINFARYATPCMSLFSAALASWGAGCIRRRVVFVAAAVFAGLTLAAGGFRAGAVFAHVSRTANVDLLRASLWLGIVPFAVVCVALAVILSAVLSGRVLATRAPGALLLCVVAEFTYFLRYGFALELEFVRLVGVVLLCGAALLVLSDKTRPAKALAGTALLIPAVLLPIARQGLPPARDAFESKIPSYVEFLRQSSGSRFIGGDVDFIPNAPSAFGISSLASLNPNQVATSAEFIRKFLVSEKALYVVPVMWQGFNYAGTSWDDFVAHRPFYNLIAVRFLMAPCAGWLSTNPQPDIGLVFKDDWRCIYEDHRALTRAFAVTAGSIQPLAIQRLEANRVDIEVEAQEPALVVLSDAFYPGWKAYVDGIETEVYRVDGGVDGAFRGVAVRKGAKGVSFQYMPVGFWRSVLVSFGSLFCCLALLPDWNRRKRNQLQGRTDSPRSNLHSYLAYPGPPIGFTAL